MLEMIMYGVCFFVITLVIQSLLHNVRKNRNAGNNSLWTGRNALITICVMGIVTMNINYLSAAIGFVIADEIGKSSGWH